MSILKPISRWVWREQLWLNDLSSYILCSFSCKWKIVMPVHYILLTLKPQSILKLLDMSVMYIFCTFNSFQFQILHNMLVKFNTVHSYANLWSIISLEISSYIFLEKSYFSYFLIHTSWEKIRTMGEQAVDIFQGISVKLWFEFHFCPIFSFLLC